MSVQAEMQIDHLQGTYHLRRVEAQGREANIAIISICCEAERECDAPPTHHETTVSYSTCLVQTLRRNRALFLRNP